MLIQHLENDIREANKLKSYYTAIAEIMDKRIKVLNDLYLNVINE